MDSFLKKISLGTLFLLLFSIAWYPQFPATRTATTPLFMTALADDDEDEEDEEEDEDEDEDEDEEEYEEESVVETQKTKTIKVVKEVIEYRPVTETVIVTEAAYAADTDSDGLVDAIDPDPSVSQIEYFTDTDNDGVPNALDLYQGEDDFAYYEFETDDNNNGILDSYENI